MLLVLKKKHKKFTGKPGHSPGAPPAGSSHAEGGARMWQITVQQAIVEPQAASGHGSDPLL